MMLRVFSLMASLWSMANIWIGCNTVVAQHYRGASGRKKSVGSTLLAAEKRKLKMKKLSAMLEEMHPRSFHSKSPSKRARNILPPTPKPLVNDDVISEVYDSIKDSFFLLNKDETATEIGSLLLSPRLNKIFTTSDKEASDDAIRKLWAGIVEKMRQSEVTAEQLQQALGGADKILSTLDDSNEDFPTQDNDNPPYMNEERDALLEELKRRLEEPSGPSANVPMRKLFVVHLTTLLCKPAEIEEMDFYVLKNWFAEDVLTTIPQREDPEQEVKELKQEIAKLEEDLDKKEKDATDQKNKIAGLEENLEQKEKELKKKVADVDVAETKVTDLEEQVKKLEEEKDDKTEDTTLRNFLIVGGIVCGVAALLTALWFCRRRHSRDGVLLNDGEN